MTTNKYEQYNLLKHWRSHLSHGTFITKMLVESRQMKGNANTVCLDLWQCVHEKFSAWKTSTYIIIFKIVFSKPKVTAKMTIHVLVNDGKRFAFLVMLNAICYEANEITENVLHKTDSVSACLKYAIQERSIRQCVARCTRDDECRAVLFGKDSNLCQALGLSATSSYQTWVSTAKKILISKVKFCKHIFVYQLKR